MTKTIPLADQATARPTNKVLATAGGTIVLTPMVHSAVVEVWPQIAPAVLVGEATTTLVAVALSAVVSLGIAWFVPDRANVPRS